MANEEISYLAQKLGSRKFWVAVAAALASIGTSIGGLATGNPSVAEFGVICLIVSQAIYSFCEAYVDAASAKAETKSTTITASTSSAAAVAALTGTDATTTSSKKKTTEEA